MSAKQLVWALTRKGISPTERVVLMILADRSDADGWSFYAQETIAKKAEVTRKTARTALQALEEKGFITRGKRTVGNLRTSDHIQIAMGKNSRSSLGKNFSQAGKKLPTIPSSPYGVGEDREEAPNGAGYPDGAGRPTLRSITGGRA